MGLLYPAALGFLCLLPVLVLAYLTRERPKRAIVSSLLAFRALSGRRRERFARRPHLNWTFFVELAVLGLAALAMAGPYLMRRSKPIAVVLDNSAAMQVKTTSGATRFDAARDQLIKVLGNEPADDPTTVYLCAPQPHQMGAPFPNPSAALVALAAIGPLDAPADPQALAGLIDDLASSHRYNRIVYAGARAIATPIPAGVTAIAVGGAAPNYAIGSFALRREVFGASALHARIMVANFSPAAQTLELKLSAGGKTVAHAAALVEPDGVAAIDFSNLTAADVYRADLAPADPFMLDNVAWATGGSVRPVSVLFITPTPADAAGLDSIPGVRVATVAPEAFTPADLKDIDVAVFEYSAPKELPAVNTLLVMPPPGDPVFGLSVAKSGPVRIARWTPTGALTDSVNFRLLNVRAGELFAAHPWMQPVVSGGRGALLMRGERGGHRFIAAGFNPFPYLGRRNLPMSVLTLNILSYLAGIGASGAAWHTGEPFLVPAGIVRIVLPSGAAVPVKPGTLFTRDSEQGIYQLASAAGVKTARAVNLGDLNVSDFSSAPELRLEVSGPGPAGLTRALITRRPLAEYLLALILILAALEAIVIYRRRRPAAP